MKKRYKLGLCGIFLGAAVFFCACKGNTGKAEPSQNVEQQDIQTEAQAESGSGGITPATEKAEEAIKLDSYHLFKINRGFTVDLAELDYYSYAPEIPDYTYASGLEAESVSVNKAGIVYTYPFTGSAPDDMNTYAHLLHKTGFIQAQEKDVQIANEEEMIALAGFFSDDYTILILRTNPEQNKEEGDSLFVNIIPEKAIMDKIYEDYTNTPPHDRHTLSDYLRRNCAYIDLGETDYTISFDVHAGSEADSYDYRVLVDCQILTHLPPGEITQETTADFDKAFRSRMERLGPELFDAMPDTKFYAAGTAAVLDNNNESFWTGRCAWYNYNAKTTVEEAKNPALTEVIWEAE